MKQLKLSFTTKAPSLTSTDVFHKIDLGELTKFKFFKWLREHDKKVETLAYNKGYREGFEAGRPKERYQGEFGIRSNY